MAIPGVVGIQPRLTMQLRNQWLMRLSDSLLFPQWRKPARKYHTVRLGSLRYQIRSNSPDLLTLREVVESHVYENAQFRIHSGDTVVDIGAHIGSFAIPAARKCSPGKLYAFEPARENFMLLKKNISLNRLTNIRAFRQAVSANNSLRSFYPIPGNATLGSLYQATNSTREKIRSISLRNIIDHFRLARIDFLKIDAEGSEYEILFNTPSAMFKKIGCISLEWHDLPGSPHNHHRLRKFLIGKEFQVKQTAHPLKIILFGKGYFKAWKK